MEIGLQTNRILWIWVDGVDFSCIFGTHRSWLFHRHFVSPAMSRRHLGSWGSKPSHPLKHVRMDYPSILGQKHLSSCSVLPFQFAPGQPLAIRLSLAVAIHNVRSSLRDSINSHIIMNMSRISIALWSFLISRRAHVPMNSDLVNTAFFLSFLGSTHFVFVQLLLHSCWIPADRIRERQLFKHGSPFLSMCQQKRFNIVCSISKQKTSLPLP